VMSGTFEFLLTESDVHPVYPDEWEYVGEFWH
jgi:hypothetical protein